jgi:2-phosphosulfolactate phosphatase
MHTELPSVQAATVVVLDVIRATTTAVSAVAAGRRCFPAPSIEAAVSLAARLDRPVLAGELGGFRPFGFEVQNSPVELLQRDDGDRPVLLLSTSGTRAMVEAAAQADTFAACLRNTAAQAEALAGSDRDVLILGADSRGEFRDEDQLCATRIAEALMQAGFTARDPETERIVERWAGQPDDAFLGSRSVRYLRETGQDHDLTFILDHVNDLDTVFPLVDGEVRMRSAR